MDDVSIFPDKEIVPDEKTLARALGESYLLWKDICAYVYSRYPKAKPEWSYAGKKYGWSFRIKDAKRTILYFLPRDHYFKVALVFGQKATDTILRSNVSVSIKSDLQAAKVYAEGRGIRIKALNNNLEDIRFLLDTKLTN